MICGCGGYGWLPGYLPHVDFTLPPDIYPRLRWCRLRLVVGPVLTVRCPPTFTRFVIVVVTFHVCYHNTTICRLGYTFRYGCCWIYLVIVPFTFPSCGGCYPTRCPVDLLFGAQLQTLHTRIVALHFTHVVTDYDLLIGWTPVTLIPCAALC